MALPEHSKIINKVARKVFKEYGIICKGQSRKWIDDQYWFTTGIEFQPSGYSKGTYLNVGVNFNWYQESYFSYDIGYRESSFVTFLKEEQFEKEMDSLVALALKRTLEYRKKLSNLEIATKTIIDNTFTSDAIWGNYHRAIICGLNNEPNKSEHYFDLLLKNKLEYDWQLKLEARVESLKSELTNTAKFKEQIDDIIIKTRKEKKLKEIEAKSVW